MGLTWGYGHERRIVGGVVGEGRKREEREKKEKKKRKKRKRKNKK